jgi:hypothetical protein
MLLCRKLAFSVSKLPVELRTLIYEHLTVEDGPVTPDIHYHPMGTCDWSWPFHIEQISNNRLQANHWLQRKFLGPLTSEVVDT